MDDDEQEIQQRIAVLDTLVKRFDHQFALWAENGEAEIAVAFSNLSNVCRIRRGRMIGIDVKVDVDVS